MGKGSRGYFLSGGWLLHYNIIVALFGMLLIDTLQQGWYLVKNSSFTLGHYSSNIHTWAIFFLRQIANMSSMAPFWASTDSIFVPNWGPCPKPRRPEEVVYIPNDSCSHFTQRLSLRNFLSNIHVLFITIHSTSFILIIHHIHTSSYIFYLHDIFTFSLPQIPMAGRLPSVRCVRYSRLSIVFEFMQIIVTFVHIWGPLIFLPK